MNTLTQTDQSRQPTGVPIGGQYATTTRQEATDVDLGALLAPDKASHADEAIVELTTTQLLAAATAAVRAHSYKANVRFVGQDDMVQETIEAVLRYKRNNGQIVLTRPYVRVVAAGVVAIAVRGRLRAEDRKAIGIFTKKVTDLETELGRNLSGTEKDQVASRIRDEWPDPRHRPSVDFVALAQVRVLSLDQSSNDDGRTLGDTVADHSAFSTDLNADDMSVDPQTPAGQVLSGVRADKSQNRADAWELYAGLTGLPFASPRQVTPRAATAARVSMDTAGGVVNAAKTWQHGETSPATDALFSPFKDIDDTGRDNIADALVSRGAYAEEMWNSALSASSRRSR